MAAIYEATFFLALALLAIVITVFVLAVSLLGRAIKISLEEKRKAESEQTEAIERDMLAIEKQLTTARKKKGKPDIKRLEKSLRILRRRELLHKIKLWFIKLRPHLLKAPLGVFVPGALFIMAVALCGTAQNYIIAAPDLAKALWIVGAIAIALGIINVGLTLRVIQGLAVTSDDVPFARQKEVFKSSLERQSSVP